jgi:hypothetical protein
VAQSAEVLSGALTYTDPEDPSISVCNHTEETVIKAIRLNVPQAFAFNGTFSPSEWIHFADAGGTTGDPRSGLTNATTPRTFEIALIDTAVRLDGSLETNATDDFGIVIQVEQTEPWATVVDGEFVFLSFTGGLQGADLDSLHRIPPGDNLATIILLDLDNLHDVLGIRSIEALYLVDANDDGEVDVIEAFSLNPTVTGDYDGDGDVDSADYAIFADCASDPGGTPNPTSPTTPQDCLNVFDVDSDTDVDLDDFDTFQRLFSGG